MADASALTGSVGGVFTTLITGVFYLIVGVAVIGLAWWVKTNILGYPYKVILEERRGRDVLTTILGGRFEEVENPDTGKRLVFKIKGFPHQLQQINYSHVQADNSVRIYRAGQNEFRPVKVDVSEESLAWQPLIDPSWERAHVAAVERMVRMKAEANWVKEYAWVMPLGVCLIVMMVVVVAVLDGMTKATDALTTTAGAWKAANTAPASPEVQKAASEQPPVIFSLAGAGAGYG